MRLNKGGRKRNEKGGSRKIQVYESKGTGSRHLAKKKYLNVRVITGGEMSINK